MSNPDWFVIGISGVTCGGKSTLAKALHKKIEGSILMFQDDYFLPESSDKHIFIPELNHFNWDTISSLDMDKMKHDIAEALSRIPDVGTSGILILDGFLLFTDEWIAARCNKKFFFTLPYEECLKRRKSRVYNPPDVPGYFEKCVWPEYVKSKEIVFETNKDIVILDSLKNINRIIEEVYLEISKHCKSSP